MDIKVGKLFRVTSTMERINICNLVYCLFNLSKYAVWVAIRISSNSEYN